MSTVNQDESKAINILKLTGKESEWDHWFEKFLGLARARGFVGILLGTEEALRPHEDSDKMKSDGSYELTDAERKEKKRLRQANGNAYINLQLSCVELPYDLVSLAKTEELPDGCARDAWERLASEYDVTCRIWGLQPLIPLLQYVNRLGFEICSVNRTRKLGYINLNWPRCSAWVTESLALTDGSFCRKQNTLYFRLCKICEFMMCILIVDHQFNRMHPWCSWECMLPGRCSPGKRCHTFWNRNIVLLPILLGKVNCVPKIHFVNCML